MSLYVTLNGIRTTWEIGHRELGGGWTRETATCPCGWTFDSRPTDDTFPGVEALRFHYAHCRLSRATEDSE